MHCRIQMLLKSFTFLCKATKLEIVKFDKDVGSFFWKIMKRTRILTEKMILQNSRWCIQLINIMEIKQDEK